MFSGKRAAVALIACGIFSMLNGFIASYNNSERSVRLPKYMNTHWITLVIVCAGLVHRTTVSGDYFGEVFSFSLNLLCLCISLTSIVADIGNLKFLNFVSDEASPLTLLLFNVDRYYLYNILDILCCVMACYCCVVILKYLLQSNNHLPNTGKHPGILGLGTGLTCISVVRGALFLWEFSLNKGMKYQTAYYLNYTVDEPAWIVIAIAVGTITVMSSEGSMLLRGVSIALSCTLIWPAIFYLWVDYRQLLGAEIESNGVGIHLLILFGTIVLGIVQAFVLLATALMQLSQFPGTCKMRIQPSLRYFFIGSSCTFLLLLFAVLSIDVYAFASRQFHTVFHASEQKTVFYLLILTVSTFVSIVPGNTSLTVPLSFTVCILTANSTIFQLASYFYLTNNKYFHEQLCREFIWSDAICHSAARKHADVTVHLFEALAHFCVLVCSLFYGIVLIRICRVNVNNRELNDTDKKKCRKLENFIRLMGVIMCLGALAIIIALFLRDTHYDSIHPLITIYGFIYHLSIAISLIVYPLYQIVSSENMYKYSMTVSTLICISAVRFVDTLSHLDYRGTGDTLKPEWQVHTVVDVISLFCNLLTLITLLHMRTIGKAHAENMQDIDLDFNNPLTTTNSELGHTYEILPNPFLEHAEHDIDIA